MSKKFVFRERDWLLEKFFNGNANETDKLDRYLLDYWKENSGEEKGLKNINRRIFERFLRIQPTTKFRTDKTGNEIKDPITGNPIKDLRNTGIPVDKEEKEFADSMLIIVLTMRRRTQLYSHNYSKKRCSNLNTILSHWNLQSLDPTIPDYLTGVLYSMDKINHYALVASKIEWARRIRLHQNSTNLNNEIVKSITDSAKRDYAVERCHSNQSERSSCPYICNNDELELVINIQEILALSRTSSHSKIGEMVKELHCKIDNTKEQTIHIKTLKWWCYFIQYRSFSLRNLEKESSNIHKKLKGLEKEDTTKYLSSLWGSLTESDSKPISTNLKIRKRLRYYYEARQKEINYQIYDKKQCQPKDWEEWSKKEEWKNNNTILYSIIHTGLQKGWGDRKFPRTPSKHTYSPSGIIRRINTQCHMVHEAIDTILIRKSHYSPTLLIYLLHDFMYRMLCEYRILSGFSKITWKELEKKLEKPRKQDNAIDWVKEFSSSSIIAVLKHFKGIIISRKEFMLTAESQPSNNLLSIIKGWITKLDEKTKLDGKTKSEEVLTSICRVLYVNIKKFIIDDKNPEKLSFTDGNSDLKLEYLIHKIPHTYASTLS